MPRPFQHPHERVGGSAGEPDAFAHELDVEPGALGQVEDEGDPTASIGEPIDLAS
jgi:hypothetical protein